MHYRFVAYREGGLQFEDREGVGMHKEKVEITGRCIMPHNLTIMKREMKRTLRLQCMQPIHILSNMEMENPARSTQCT